MDIWQKVVVQTVVQISFTHFEKSLTNTQYVLGLLTWDIRFVRLVGAVVVVVG